MTSGNGRAAIILSYEDGSLSYWVLSAGSFDAISVYLHPRRLLQPQEHCVLVPIWVGREYLIENLFRCY